MRKVFISFHHDNDQKFKNKLAAFGEKHDIFEDCSVEIGDIPTDGSLSAEDTRKKIRDEYLSETTVTILLVGQETRKRKHIDWEIHSSMIDGITIKRSGILVVNLPTIGEFPVIEPRSEENNSVYPEVDRWRPVGSKEECKRDYPHMPDRIIDNLVKPDAKISVTNWSKCFDTEKLRYLVDAAHCDRGSCKYDVSRPLRRNNTKPSANKNRQT